MSQESLVYADSMIKTKDAAVAVEYYQCITPPDAPEGHVQFDSLPSPPFALVPALKAYRGGEAQTINIGYTVTLPMADAGMVSKVDLLLRI